MPVTTLTPDADGLETDWVIIGNQWDKVDEGVGAHDGDTTVISAQGTGKLGDLGFPALPAAAGKVRAFTVRAVMKYSAGAGLYADTSLVDGAGADIGGGVGELTPASDDWTTSSATHRNLEVTAAAFNAGFLRLASAGTPALFRRVWVTALELDVTYTGTEGIKDGIQSYLIGQAAISSQFGTRVYPGVAPSSAGLPYVIYDRVSSRQIRTTAGPSRVMVARIQLEVFDSTGPDAWQGSELIRLELDGFRGDADGLEVLSIQKAAGSENLERASDGSEPPVYNARCDYLVTYRDNA